MPQGSWREFNQDPTAQPERSKSFLNKAELNVRVQKTRGGKGGKTVTVISGLKLDEADRRSLLKRLKSSCGTGGTAKGEFLELQGDQVMALLEFLRKEGYRPKKSGG
mgnify:CR=1 FL=1